MNHFKKFTQTNHDFVKKQKTRNSNNKFFGSYSSNKQNKSISSTNTEKSSESFNIGSFARKDLTEENVYFILFRNLVKNSNQKWIQRKTLIQ